MKRYLGIGILLSLALALMACQLLQKSSKPAVQPTGVATASIENNLPTSVTTPALETNAPTGATAPALEANTPTGAAPQTEQADPTARKKPPQSQAAGIQPKEMRAKLTHLAYLVGFEVLDENGHKLGIASDYIINTCETYIIYILMQPVASLNIPPGKLVVIPYEAVTINSGVLDAQKKTIQLQLLPGQFAGAPTLTPGQQLTPTDWEGPARAFWMKSVRVGVLATSCNVSGGPTYKVAYATQLLAVKLYDGNKVLLGTVQDAILEPESGQFGAYLVKPAKGDGLTMVSMAVTNIPKEALLPGATLSLVLLAQPAAFSDAPHIATADQADDFTLQAKVRSYWGR